MSDAALSELKFIVGGTDAAKFKSLATQPWGPLLASQRQWIQAVTKRCVVDRAGNVDPTMHFVEYLLLEDAELESSLLDGAPNFTIHPDRATRFFKDLLGVGLSFDEVRSSEAAKREIRRCFKLLSADQRRLTEAEVLREVNPTETWLDAIKVRRLRGADDSNAVLLQLRQLLPGIWHEDGFNQEPFDSLVQWLIPSERDGEDGRLQAAAIIQWMRKTRPPVGYDTYVEHDNAEDEIARRNLESDEARFRPLFEVGWGVAHEELTEIFDEETPGNEVAEALTAALIKMGIATTLLPSAVKTFVDKVRPKLATLHRLAATEARSKRNDHNLATIIAAVADASRSELDAGKMDGSQNPEGKMGRQKEQYDMLYLKTGFSELHKAIASIVETTPLDQAAAVKACLESAEAAGQSFVIGGRDIPLASFTSARGVCWDKNRAPLMEVVKKAVKSKAGLASDVTANVKEDDVAKWLTGKLKMTSDKDGVHLWRMFEEVVKARSGAWAVQQLLQGRNELVIKDPLALFLAPELMEEMTDAIVAFGGIFLKPAETTGSLEAVWRHMIARSKEIHKIPDWEPRKLGLMVLQVRANELIFEKHGADIISMINTPLGIAQKPTRFMKSKGEAMDAWNDATASLDAIKKDLNLEGRALSRKSPEELKSTQQAVERMAPDLKASPAGKTVVAWVQFTTGGRNKRPLGGGDNDGWYEDWSESRKETSKGWGEKAAKFGVAVKGQDMLCGHLKVTFPADVKMPVAGECAAKWMPGNQWKKATWCTSKDCDTYESHKHPDVWDGDTFKGTVSHDSNKTLDWPTGVVVLKQPVVKQSSGAGSSSQWSPGGGGRGKGRGQGSWQSPPIAKGSKGGKPSKGKGSKGGKGGKGKGGRGGRRPNFGRRGM